MRIEEGPPPPITIGPQRNQGTVETEQRNITTSSIRNCAHERKVVQHITGRVVEALEMICIKCGDIDTEWPAGHINARK